VFVAGDAEETLGCNDRSELAKLRALLRDRVNTAWMRAGVSILDPATTWIDVTVRLSPDAQIDQNSQLLGATSVAAGAIVGPDTTLIDTVVGEGAVVLRTHSIGAQVGPSATVGPFSFLRPGTVLGRKAKIGGFVEAKNAELGDGAKVPHLTYVGDATIGAKANIGAGTIFANYDGVNKHRTTVGEAAFVGSDTVLIAPVEVGPGAYVAAGSAIAKDVPAGNLGLTRAPQRNVEGWTARKRPGTVSAEAAERAAADDAG
jgi:bifunctional UDP-N-acetylglucosamine pyrophosphorylase/glucosamine-1-phosphate N-acetyltransferase